MGFFKKLFGSKDDSKPEYTTKVGNGQNVAEEVPWMTDRRRKSLTICTSTGFRSSSSLSMELGRELRPVLEIANRLHAIKALVLWLMIPQENLPDAIILSFIEQNGLKDLMTGEEMSILTVARDDEQARNAIGWKFENAWPLAWYFGYKKPDTSGEMMTGDQMQNILTNYTCSLEMTTLEWIQSIETITEEMLLQEEDLFYCLHNAVRSAQLGGDTVPSNFDPVGNGGVIHERRHSLTWMLSKGVKWEDTDLST